MVNIWRTTLYNSKIWTFNRIRKHDTVIMRRIWGKLTVYKDVENKRNFFTSSNDDIRKPCVSCEGYVSLQKLNRGITLKSVCHNVA